MASDDPTIPGHACRVFRGRDLRVTVGANLGDTLETADHLCPGDIYELGARAQPLRLVLEQGGDGQRVGAGSELGRAGDGVRLVSRLTFMTPEGERVETLVIAHTPAGGRRETHVLPLSPMAARREYTLLHADTAPEPVPLADLVCISFTQGTMITMADGHQRAIETLHPGDRVLTRDHGPQPVRWIGHAMLRAEGAFAPVVIPAGTMGNAGDLIVSQHHRMFLYLRDRGALPTAELLVQAKHLADGERIFVREGGYADYYSLIFDRHEIIYAEGIPAESLQVSEATLSRLPAEFTSEMRDRFPNLRHDQHFGTEAGRDQIGPLLRR